MRAFPRIFDRTPGGWDIYSTTRGGLMDGRPEHGREDGRTAGADGSE